MYCALVVVEIRGFRLSGSVSILLIIQSPDVGRAAAPEPAPVGRSGRLHPRRSEAEIRKRTVIRRVISSPICSLSAKCTEHYDMSAQPELMLSLSGQPCRNELKPIQCEVGIDGFDQFCLLVNKGRLAAGGDNPGVRAQLRFHTSDDSIHQRHIAVKDPTLHAANC